MDLFRRRKATEDELHRGAEEMRLEQERLAREALEERLQEQEEPMKKMEIQTLEGCKASEEVGLKTPNPQVHSMATPPPVPEETEVVRSGGRPEIEDQARVMPVTYAPWTPEHQKRSEERGAGMAPGLQEPYQPLFDAEQVRRFEELQRAAPMIMARQPEPLRPAWMVQEEKKNMEAEIEKEVFAEQKRMSQYLKDPEKLELLDKMRKMEQEMDKMHKDSETLKLSNRVLWEQNEKLKDEVKKKIEEECQVPKEEFGTPYEEEPRGEGVETPRRLDGGIDPPPKESPADPKMMMKGMLKLMEGMQMMQSQILEVKKDKAVEVVRGSVSELPRLPEWKAETAPLDLTDWLLTIEPAMGDLSDGSQQWWEQVVETARKWYSEHQEKTPLEKVSHRPTMPAALTEPRFQRLEKRATALLMAAIPANQQEEVIAGKEVSTIAVLGRLMTSYQPGGLSEKAAILSALDAPEEAQGLSQAVIGLRKWLRWHRRAGEIGVTRPDATIQVKGLGRLMKKILKDNGDLAFRIQLAKSTLAIDTTPTEAAVMTYANHLLAEVEQVAHQDKKKVERALPVITDPKMKKIEEGGKTAEGKGGGKERSYEGKGGMACKYFISEHGCKKGRSCTFTHTLDDQRRCWNCGSTSHYAPKCDRPREGERPQRTEAKGEGKQVRSVKKEDSPTKVEEVPVKREESQNEVMKELLEEANKMLKSMAAPKIEEREGKLEKLQKQLDDLRQLKVFRLSRMEINETEGLLDSGATHSLRPKKKGEDVMKLKEIQVTLACGKKVPLKMTKGGTMIAAEATTEPIIPMGKMINLLGCSLGWTKEDGLVIHHPKKGLIQTVERGGCPHVSLEVALELIDELESCCEEVGGEDHELKKMAQKAEEEEEWLRDLVKSHPVLKRLPGKIQEELVRTPAHRLGEIPGVNKSMKKRWSKHGVTLHLYSGKDEGFTLKRAVREQGGDESLVLEVDVKNGEAWDMLQDGMYKQLLRLAMDDLVGGVVCAPNCRTRSVLRHFPIPEDPNAPRPVRSWEGGEWGSSHITPEERKKVEEDDVLMWRAIMLTIVATHVRRAQRPKGPDVRFLVEQPAPPEDYPEVVSWWRTKEWKDLKKIYQWAEVSLRQGDFGGKAVKPTIVGGNLTMEFPGGVRKRKKIIAKDEVKSSKELERWAPGMMRQVARDVILQIQGSSPELRKLNWDEHIQMNHTPFRRDCRICQETR